MNRRVLTVQSSSHHLGRMAATLEDDFVVHSVGTAEEALRASHRDGPFAVVIADYDLPDTKGVDLLVEFERRYPDTTRMLFADTNDPLLAVEAMRSGSVFRFLPLSTNETDFHRSVQVGMQKYRRVEEERLLTEQLQFSRESLLSLTENLENRLAAQISRLRGLHVFAAAINDCKSMEELARLTAETTSRLMDERPVEVVLEGIDAPDVRGAAGGELPSDVVMQAIATRDGSVGRIHLALGPPVAKKMTQADLDFVGSIAANAAVAAHNLINRHERDNAQHATIFALAQLAEYRDDETGKHLERVTEYCRLTARALHEDGKHVALITDGFVRDLALAAPLHDIGKVGVPDAILLKPGKLTEEEWEIMRKHTTIGAETLRSVLENSGEQSFLRIGHEIAWCHHEKWAGGGYPRNLSGDEIPLSARIMALADIYDALTTRRPYKRAWTHEEAKNYILEQRGIQFDPDIVDVFMRHHRRFDEIRSRLEDHAGPEVESLADVA